MSGRYATEQAFFDSRQQSSLKQQHDAEADHTNRAILDIRMEIAMNPKSLPVNCMSALISAGRCPVCLGHLDAGRECKTCEYWAQPWVDASKALNDAAHDRREA